MTDSIGGTDAMPLRIKKIRKLFYIENQYISEIDGSLFLIHRRATIPGKILDYLYKRVLKFLDYHVLINTDLEDDLNKYHIEYTYVYFPGIGKTPVIRETDYLSYILITR